MNRIVIINHYGKTPDTRGTTRHLDMALKLYDKYKCSVELWICGNNRQLDEVHSSLKRKLVSTEYYNDIKIVRFRSISEKKGNGLRRQLNISVFSILTGMRFLFNKKSDICVLSIPPLSLFNALIIKLRGSKLVVDVEDLWPLFLKDLGLKNKIILKIMDNVANFLYNSADGIDTVSSGMKEFVENKISSKKDPNIWMSPLGVDISKYNKKESCVLGEYEWEEKFSVIYAGAHGIANNLEIILEAAAILESYQDIVFVFFGDGGEKEKLLEYTKTKGISNVYFENAVPNNIVPQILQLSDICITHLKNVESFKYVRPNKIFEYMAAGKPMICGIHGEASHVVKGANAGICTPPGDSKKIAEAVLHLYNNPDVANNLGNNGFDYVCKYGDRKLILEEFCDEIDKIVNPIEGIG